MEKFRLDFAGLKKLKEINLSVAIKVAAIVISVSALFLNDFVIIFSEAFQSEATSYILVVPFVFVYMIYRKRKMLGAVIARENDSPKTLKFLPVVSGVLLCATAVLIYWHGSYTFTPLEYHLFCLPFFVAGLTLIMFNGQTLRHAIVPIVFLLFLTPPPSEILYSAGSLLSNLSSEISNGFAQVIGIPAVLATEYATPTILVTRPDGSVLQFVVDIACSGIYGLVGFLVFTVLLTFVIRDKSWKKISLILTGIAMVYILNVIRITTIISIGYFYGENLALNFFHLFGGWVLNFLGTLLLFIVSEKVFKTRIFGSQQEQCQECRFPKVSNGDSCRSCGRLLLIRHLQIRKSDIVKIAGALIVVGLLVSIQVPVFAMSETPVSIVVTRPSGQSGISEILPQLQGYNLVFHSRDQEFEKTAQQDMALSFIYLAKEKNGTGQPDAENLSSIWVSLEIASTRYNLHRWETCLINFPLSQGRSPSVTQFELTDVQIYDNPPIIARYFAYNNTKSNVTQTVLYWYSSATFNISSTPKLENVKLSLIAFPNTVEEMQSTKEQQIEMAKNIAQYLEPNKLWSSVALSISLNGGYFAVLTAVLLLATSLYYLTERFKQKIARRDAYRKLSPSNRILVDAIKETRKENLPTYGAIAEMYQSQSVEPIDRDNLFRRMVMLKKEHIIESRIINQKDEPVEIWKA